MNRWSVAGIAVLAVGLVGYVVGIYVAYPGRAFSVTAIMVGLTLAAIAQQPPSGGAA